MTLSRVHLTAPAGAPADASAQFDDAQLVVAAASGDRPAIAAIWDRYGGLVRGVLRATLGPDDELDDMAQEIFLGLFRTVGQIRDGAALPAILSRMAVRRAGMVLRWRRVRSLVTSTPADDLPDVAVRQPDLDVRRGFAVLYALLDRVKPRHRMAFVLRDVLAMDLPEVANTMSLSESAARRAVTEGRKRVLRLAQREPRLQPFLARGWEDDGDDNE